MSTSYVIVSEHVIMLCKSIIDSAGNMYINSQYACNEAVLFRKSMGYNYVINNNKILTDALMKDDCKQTGRNSCVI